MSKKTQVMQGLIKENIIQVAKDMNYLDWPLLNSGQKKLEMGIGRAMPEDKSELNELLKQAVKHQILSIEDFGAVYIQLRQIGDVPVLREKLAELYAEKIDSEKLKYDKLASVAYGMSDLGPLVASVLGKPHATIRKESDARHDIATGRIREGDDVLLLEDAVTKAGETIKGAAKLRSIGAVVNKSVVYLNREQGGIKNAAAEGIKIYPIASMTEVKEQIKSLKTIPQDVKEYIYGK